MRKQFYGAIVLGIFLCKEISRAETQVFFTSQVSIEKILITLIDASRTSIEIALFEFRSPALQKALQRARQRGVSVRVLLDQSRPRQGVVGESTRWLGGKHLRGRGVMHNKFAVFDGSRIVTGSYNWTSGAEYSNYENLLLVDDPGVVRLFAKEFEELWSRAVEIQRLHSRSHQKKSRGIKKKRLRKRIRIYLDSSLNNG